MTAIAERTAVEINMEAGCDHASCAELTNRLYKQLNVPNYTCGMSIMAMPSSLEDWRADHRTARKRADRSQRLGYHFASIDRSLYNDAIHAINTSLDQRQGRPMSDGYLTRHNHGPLPDYPCDRHCVHTYGVVSDEPQLVAYLTLYRIGELGLVSMILGHGDHLRDDIMYLLFAGMVADQAHHGGSLFYNRHDSGTEGLRYYKERVGFQGTDIEWAFA